MNSAENVSVKPLEWKELGAGRFWPKTWYGTGVFSANYKVEQSHPGGSWHSIGGNFATFEAAKAAAQADYEQRILSCLASPPTEDADRVEVWRSSTIDRLQRAIMDDDEAVRERAAENVAVLYAHSVAPYAAALAMVREAIGELFGPKASIESEDATLLRGPEPHHEAEAQIAALRRVHASPRPEADRVEPVAWVNAGTLRHHIESGTKQTTAVLHSSQGTLYGEKDIPLYTSPRPETVGVSEAKEAVRSLIKGAVPAREVGDLYGWSKRAKEQIDVIFSALSPQEGE